MPEGVPYERFVLIERGGTIRKLTYFVAISMDGFIAGPDGEFDAFDPTPEFVQTLIDEFPETLPVHARAALGISDAPPMRFDTVVMGRGTYDPAPAAGLTSAYPHLRQYVFSRSLGSIDDPTVTVVDDDPVLTVRTLKKENGLDIWLCGGGSLAGQLVDEIDELILKVNPMILQSGIPLFTGDYSPHTFTLTDTRPHPSGVVFMHYKR